MPSVKLTKWSERLSVNNPHQPAVLHRWVPSLLEEKVSGQRRHTRTAASRPVTASLSWCECTSWMQRGGGHPPQPDGGCCWTPNKKWNHLLIIQSSYTQWWNVTEYICLSTILSYLYFTWVFYFLYFHSTTILYFYSTSPCVWQLLCRLYSALEQNPFLIILLEIRWKQNSDSESEIVKYPNQGFVGPK